MILNTFCCSDNGKPDPASGRAAATIPFATRPAGSDCNPFRNTLASPIVAEGGFRAFSTPYPRRTPVPFLSRDKPLPNSSPGAGQKIVVRDGPLSMKLYCAIGMVAVAWAHFEDIVSLCLSRILGTDHIEFLPVSANMPIKARLDSLKALVPSRLAQPGSASMIALIDQANLLSRERNKVLHASWLQGATEDVGVRLTYRAHGRFSTDVPTITAQEIAAVADQINALSAQFTGQLEQLGLYDPRHPMVPPARKDKSVHPAGN